MSRWESKAISEAVNKPSKVKMNRVMSNVYYDILAEAERKHRNTMCISPRDNEFIPQAD